MHLLAHLVVLFPVPLQLKHGCESCEYLFTPGVGDLDFRRSTLPVPRHGEHEDATYPFPSQELQSSLM
jgi:hypothetical protein